MFFTFHVNLDICIYILVGRRCQNTGKINSSRTYMYTCIKVYGIYKNNTICTRSKPTTNNGLFPLSKYFKTHVEKKRVLKQSLLALSIQLLCNIQYNTEYYKNIIMSLVAKLIAYYN